MPKFRAALVVFVVGFALGLSVFAASRLFVRSVLSADATAAVEELANRLADGDPIEATGLLSIVADYTYLDANGTVLRSASLRATDGAALDGSAAAVQAATQSAKAGGTIVAHTPLVPSLLGLTEPVVRSAAAPVASGGRTIGSVYARIDQTSSLDALSRAFSVIGIVSVGLAVLAFIAIAYAVGRSNLAGERRAFDPTRLPQDPLTGLPNRQSFETMLADAVGRAAAADQPIGVMVINLDEFHAVNHIWGHAAGDAVLKAAAERLRGFAAAPGRLARVSGDHFALLIEQDATAIAMRGLAEKLHAALGAPIDVAESSISVRASIGAALFPVNADSSDMLFRAADTALSRAKTERHEPVAFFDTDMKRRMQRRAGLERDLRRALEREELVIFYQPQLELASGRLRGYEALLRWERPGEGILAPAEFLAVAEETGLIRPLGDWVLRKACRDAAGWPDAGIVAVNFCAAQIRFQDLAGSIADALAESGLPADRLEIEIPERLFLENAADVIATLKRVKALGVRVAMDNFGVGYSGLSSLAQFPFDKIKIDKSFVDQLREETDVAAIVAAIVSLGRSLSLDITAEGVETNEQVTLLKAAGCNIVQGFLFGVPHRLPTGAGSPDQASDESPAANAVAG